jgi:hypothetical protein
MTYARRFRASYHLQARRLHSRASCVSPIEYNTLLLNNNKVLFLLKATSAFAAKQRFATPNTLIVMLFS